MTGRSPARQTKRFAGFRIAMHDPELVRLGHRLRHLRDDVHGHLDRHRAGGLELHIERPPLQVLHHHVRQAVRERVDVDDAHRVHRA